MSKYSDDFRSEIKKGFLDAVGSMADYRIRLDAGGWVDKNVLTEEDYLEICRAVEAQYIVPEPPVVEETLTESENSTEKTDETTVDEEITTEETEPPTELNNETTDTTSTNEELVEETE